MHPSRRTVSIAGVIAIAMIVVMSNGRRTVRASSDAPAWMHALTSVPLPDHDEKTDAVLLYSEESLTVQTNGKIHRTMRKAYKILRPGGREYGTAWGVTNSQQKLLSIRGWCISAQGRDYEVKDKEAIESSVANVKYGELVKDVRVKILKIPEPEPGNIVGYETEDEENLFNLQDSWDFQQEIPVRESRYTLQMPAGWEYKAVFANSPEIKPASNGNQWVWTVNNVPAIRPEAHPARDI